MVESTLLKFKMVPEKWWLEDKPFFPIGKITFQGRDVKLREGNQCWISHLTLKLSQFWKMTNKSTGSESAGYSSPPFLLRDWSRKTHPWMNISMMWNKLKQWGKEPLQYWITGLLTFSELYDKDWQKELNCHFCFTRLLFSNPKNIQKSHLHPLPKNCGLPRPPTCLNLWICQSSPLLIDSPWVYITPTSSRYRAWHLHIQRFVWSLVCILGIGGTSRFFGVFFLEAAGGSGFVRRGLLVFLLLGEGHWLKHVATTCQQQGYWLKVEGRNPAPVDREFIPLFTGFYTSQVVSRISPINSSTFQLFHLTLPEPNGSLESHVFKWIQVTSTYSRASPMMSCKIFL